MFICKFGQIDSGDVEEIGLIGHTWAVGTPSAVEVVEPGGNTVVVSSDVLHCDIIIIQKSI